MYVISIARIYVLINSSRRNNNMFNRLVIFIFHQCRCATLFPTWRQVLIMRCCGTRREGSHDLPWAYVCWPLSNVLCRNTTNTFTSQRYVIFWQKPSRYLSCYLYLHVKVQHVIKKSQPKYLATLHCELETTKFSTRCWFNDPFLHLLFL